ncbi:hypothetical protein Psi01_38770 [Planobispora siamensis]|uniref:Uncharacterized protein n=1 Tax=Planobispora siamensis TaxID=936338 RepID=A0A8J3SF85_9ACTN|nr:hypothetical protein Psi01_38770 [Planobispora siamensis]
MFGDVAGVGLGQQAVRVGRGGVGVGQRVMAVIGSGFGHGQTDGQLSQCPVPLLLRRVEVARANLWIFCPAIHTCPHARYLWDIARITKYQPRR